jgi:serine/threonine-protein kinase RsbW
VQRISFAAKTDLTDLNHVLPWFNQATEPYLPRTALIQCQTLLAEGFTNAVRHAHRGYATETPIEIEVTLLEQQLEIRIWDYGQPFDLIHQIEKLPERVDVDASSGRGLKLLKKIADRFEYSRLEGDRNCLLIVKSY